MNVSEGDLVRLVGNSLGVVIEFSPGIGGYDYLIYNTKRARITYYCRSDFSIVSKSR